MMKLNCYHILPLKNIEKPTITYRYLNFTVKEYRKQNLLP